MSGTLQEEISKVYLCKAVGPMSQICST